MCDAYASTISRIVLAVQTWPLQRTRPRLRTRGRLRLSRQARELGLVFRLVFLATPASRYLRKRKTRRRVASLSSFRSTLSCTRAHRECFHVCARCPRSAVARATRADIFASLPVLPPSSLLVSPGIAKSFCSRLIVATVSRPVSTRGGPNINPTAPPPRVCWQE